MSTRNKNNTGITLALVGGGALFLWLLWRGRGKGNGGNGDRSDPSAPITVWILAGDRLALDRVDGATIDLATVVTLARAAGAVTTYSTGDARYGWVEKVNDTLRAAGLKVDHILPKRNRASAAA